MNTNITRLRKYIRRIEAMVLAVIIATSLTYTVTAAENNLEQEEFIEQEEESEQEDQETTENDDIENTDQEENGTEDSSKNENEEDSSKDNDKDKNEEELSNDEDANEEDSDIEEETVSENHAIEYSVQTDVEGYKIKLEAYDGVFPEGEELSLSATQIEDQEILDEIDSKLSDVCEGEFKQISFDIKVLNAAGEELQPDRSKYIDDEDIIPIQLSIELSNEEIEGEVEVFHFADDLSSMECLVSTVDGDEIIVEPEHFSVFTILKTTYGSYYDNLTPPTGYRTYIEWMPNSTAGLRRLQKIYVYAEAGEEIYFGSSSFVNLPQGEVTKSLADSFGYDVGLAPDEASIAVTLPYNNSAGVMQENDTKNYYTIYSSANPATVINQIETNGTLGDRNIYLFTKEEINDVENDSSNAYASGTIYNWQQEALGPDIINQGGYKPLSFTAPVTGVYTFRFFGTQYTSVAVAPKAKKTDAFPQYSKNYVGAWDITVTKSETDATQIPGRTFTDALFWTIGANISGNEHIMDEYVYALTKDGFEYKIDFNGIDPFGFVFFTNKRGFLVSSDDHEDGHYRSLARSVKSKKNTLDDLIEMGVHINSRPTTDNDESYFITFEKADGKLLKHYTGKEVLTSKDSIGTDRSAYTEFKFKGLNSSTDNEGTEGYGGYFSFKYDSTMETAEIKPSTYEIVIDFTGNEVLEEEYGYAPGKHNEVILSNTLVDNLNTIYWDGKDEYGNVVIGNNSGIEYNIVSFVVKAGEVHFPLLDVENNRYGIKVVMQNDIPGIDKSWIYYDNSDSDVYGKNIGDRKEKLTGVSSNDGAMPFSSNAGDYCAIDIWTDYKIDTVFENQSFKLYGLDNEKAFFEVKTAWQYYYSTMDGREHFDSSTPLPQKAEVQLQYRIVDKNTVGIGGIDTGSPNWQVDDTGDGKDWKVYSGPVTVSLQIDKDTLKEEKINLDHLATDSFDKSSPAGIYNYKSVTIHSYAFVDNEDPLTADYNKYEASDGLCVFKELPLHPKNGADYDQSKFYQYRVVVISDEAIVGSYAKDELFDRVAAVDIPEGAGGHITKDIYLEETLDYRFTGVPEFNLEFDQLWNDAGMPVDWVSKHKPKAVRVAILYGVPLYEDVDKGSEYDITTEKGYYGEDVEVVWRKIQNAEYLTLDIDGGVKCKDSKGTSRNLSSLGGPFSDNGYAAYYPVGKYMSNGDPYFYKIRPVSYSIDGEHFTEIEYWDVNKIVPKLSLPEFYGIDDTDAIGGADKSRVLFYEEAIGDGKELYPKAVKFTDIPESAEIELTKKDESDNPIIGKTTSYEITNKDGNLMFVLDSEGKYIYKGLEGAAGLPDGATKTIKTSSVDSIVHITGLPLKEYTIREVGAPEGYQLNHSPIYILPQDFLSDSTMDVAGVVKLYRCKKSQKDSRISAPGSGSGSGSSDSSNKNTNSDSDLSTSQSSKAGPNVVPITDQTLIPKEDEKATAMLPKTGGLIGSLVAMVLGVLMIGFGIYLIKPSNKQNGNRD